MFGREEKKGNAEKEGKGEGGQREGLDHTAWLWIPGILPRSLTLKHNASCWLLLTILKLGLIAPGRVLPWYMQKKALLNTALNWFPSGIGLKLSCSPGMWTPFRWKNSPLLFQREETVGMFESQYSEFKSNITQEGQQKPKNQHKWVWHSPCGAQWCLWSSWNFSQSCGQTS